MSLKAVIFDMDGVLIDTEPAWREVGARIYSSYGVPIVAEDCKQTTGMRLDEEVLYWYKKFPWQGKNLVDVVQEVQNAMIEEITYNSKSLPGAMQALDQIKNMGLKVGLASSSAEVVINTVLKKLQRENFFDVVYSAEFEPYGKPHPAVYLTTAQKLGVDPEDCIAIEDSLNGTIAAKAARMKCITVPDAERRNRKEFGIADMVLDSLEEFNQNVIDALT